MTPKEFILHPTLCTLPWTGLFLDPTGDVKNCSISLETLGNINQEPLPDILASSKNKRIKENLLLGNKISACNSCWSHEELEKDTSIKFSNREYHRKTFKNIPLLQIFDSADNFSLKQVDLRWRNTCNLACVYCDWRLSSTWAKEVGEVANINDSAIEATKEYIFKNIETLEYIYLCGGEPLLMKENLEFINLIKVKNPDVAIRVNTNITNLNSPIYNSLLECKNVHWIVSIESTGPEFEFIRYGAKWEQFLNNIKILKRDADLLGHKITFNMVWCSLSAFAIFDSIDAMLDLGFHENSFIVHPLNDPIPLEIKHLHDSNISKLREILNKRIADANSQYWLHKSYTVMISHLTKLGADKNIQLLIDYLNKLDGRRNTNGIKLFDNLL
jgi:radical SAM protein with 4Fe4S-binding SPASM domain